MCSMLEWVAFTSVAFHQPIGGGASTEGGPEQLLQPAVIDALLEVWTRALGQAG
ncbi:hypothetical protein KSP35_19410 [Aquihabitans sp. G128]|uniref:hypothetical protein n=1 Tax=Aquihabitans sp. G128 TaxID=2849779 RepID=UPI001C22B047|nr:hypothetical protein [Aquihabitans sp. G128]QXC60467.1 hypothetical protein KSP35_19410 [Aquihabitans sp. G128]